MKSRIYLAEVWHHRLGDTQHFFRYKLPFFAFDLDELRHVEARNRLFSWNRFNVFSLHDSDYLFRKKEGNGTIKERLQLRLSEFESSIETDRVMLVTVPRFFNYVFNPVSFYYCFSATGELSGCVAEVNNTYGEKHLYFLEEKLDNPGLLARFLKPKVFFVSPFYQREGDYEFLFGNLEDKLDIRMNVTKSEKPFFRAGLKGNGKPFTTGETLRVLAKTPIQAALTMPRILIQAAKLYRKKLPVYSKPLPQTRNTVKEADPHFSEQLGRRFFDQLLGKSTKGAIRVIYPDQTSRVFMGNGEGLTVELKIREWKFFGRLLASGDIGVGESYVEGEWMTPDLTALLSYFVDNFSAVKKRSAFAVPLRFATQIFRSLVRLNTRTGAKSNIQAHYDLGNSFFELFLDPTMMYSSAIFPTEESTLEEAQLTKLDRLIERAQLKPTDHVLEIGTGWGGFAMRAASTIGCRVTTVTISKQQYTYARQRVKKAGLDRLIDIRFSDYRDVRGKFDKIVSVEMLEAIGHNQLPTFFAKCDKLLAMDGLLVLQVITMPEQRYNSYRRNSDFIQKYIFPGAVVPSLGAIHQAATTSSSFTLERLENIAPHYAKTLRLWRERLFEKKSELHALGFDEYFLRMWEYYFAYCEAGFGRKILSDFHFVYTRPNNLALKQID
jgi:cyclopropane-fatty-acyl-phospholipid synthase